MYSVFHICKVRIAGYRGATECGDCSVEGGIGGICGARETGSPEDKLKCFACDRSTSTRLHSKSVCARESRLAPVCSGTTPALWTFILIALIQVLKEPPKSLAGTH